MRKLRRFISILLLSVLLTGCASGAAKTDKQLEAIAALGTSPDDVYRTWYEIFVYSYCDSDGDGIGDLNGVTQKIPELQQLGITGIWLMPIHSSTTYHKYNVSDYESIDPDYGTMEDFENLMNACDQAGIRVILDLVVNHTGSNHAWFRQAVTYLQSLQETEKPDAQVCPYLDYYYFKLTDEVSGAWTPIDGTAYSYESKFDRDMPDLNLSNENVRQEIKQIMEFWMEKGVAGFRLDAVKEYFSGSASKNIEFLSWIQTTVLSIRSDAYLVAEVWDTFSTVTEYYESGITSIFNYPFGDSSGKIIEVLRGAGNPSIVSTYATALEKADRAYLGSNPDYVDAPFLSNHDVGRIAGFVSGNTDKIKMAAAMNLFMSGSAFVYYGEEIGMSGSGNDPSKRAPMYWNADRNEGTTQLPPDCVLPDSYPLGSLEEQKTDANSVYNYYRQAIAIRNALPVISHGRTTAELPLNQECVSAQRKTWDDETCLILMNICEEPAEVDLSQYADWSLTASLSTNGKTVRISGTTLKLPAWGIAILTPDSGD